VVQAEQACELHRHQPLRALRSGTTTTLHRPHASSDFHNYSFAVSAQAIWNNIPASIRDSATLVTCKTAFKTHLFNSAYTSCYWLPSMGASDSLFHAMWRQLKKFMLIDSTVNLCACTLSNNFQTKWWFVRHNQSKMYGGHGCLCVYVPVCPLPHSHTTTQTHM